MIQIGIIGDIHTKFDAVDVEAFNRSPYDLLLCTGDLGHFQEQYGLTTAETLSQLRRPTLMVFGNHDTLSMPQQLAEMRGPEALKQLTARGHVERTNAWQTALAPITVGGYSLHTLPAETLTDPPLTIIVGRPFSFGGSWLDCVPTLTTLYGVDSLAASAAKMKQLVDSAETTDLLFLSHNGPTGLGTTPDAIWGCDFNPKWDDFGDPDLREAIDYATASGKRVRAVVAGHMHHELTGGGQRQWLVEQNGITYINAARVPRIFEQDGQTLRHHVRLEIEQDAVRVSAEIQSESSPSFGH